MNRTKLIKIFLLSGLIFFISSKIYAQNENFLGNWISDEPVEITIDDQSFILTGIDFLSAKESPRYEGWLEEAVSYEELIDGEIRSGLNIFVYKIDKESSTLTLKNIDSRVNLEKGLVITFTYRFKEEINLILNINEHEISLNRE